MVERVATCVMMGGCLVAFSLGLIGCEDSAKRAALTEEEIQRLTYAPKPDRPDELLVSGEIVTCEDVTASPLDQDPSAPSFREALVELAQRATLQEFVQLARPQIRQRLFAVPNGKISRIVLYKQARRQLGEKVDEQLDKLAEKELRKFILDHGGNGAAADEALQKMGLNRARYREQQKRDILRKYYGSSKLAYNRPVTHRELLACYERIKDEAFFQPGLLQVRLIDIKVPEVELADPNDDPTETARAVANELLARIEAGEDFGELAERYSHGHRSAFGGLWKPRDPKALAPPYDVLAEEARDVEVGQVVGPIEVQERIFIMKLEQKQQEGYQPLGEVQDTVERQILLEREREVLKQLDAEVAQQAATADTDRFIDHCLERLYLSVNPPSDRQ